MHPAVPGAVGRFQSMWISIALRAVLPGSEYVQSNLYRAKPVVPDCADIVVLTVRPFEIADSISLLAEAPWIAPDC